MIEHNFDTTTSVLYVRLKSSIEKGDFVELAKAVDPYIEKTGGLKGVLIEARTFPGWDSFGALVEHIRFVREHHRKIKRLCIVTDSALGNVAEHLASHFIAAEIKHFPAGALDAAKQWITSAP